ncbi:hypothetical protein AMELA_G00216830 [Ameiurus melas]|uniref:Uncharacterized protein n=1 Tax=Ameiurus melas TaxID=219545 RepID=A0A7J6A311_AMEME|nr:hypothetical protein AMELA_G00216830 [Ameiurus melas]
MGTGPCITCLAVTHAVRGINNLDSTLTHILSRAVSSLKRHDAFIKQALRACPGRPLALGGCSWRVRHPSPPAARRQRQPRRISEP